MAKFCTNCGKKLEEKEVCNCIKPEESNLSKNKTIIDYATEIMETTKSMFSKPIDTMKTHISENTFINGVIMLCLSCMVMALYIIAMMKQGLNIVNAQLGLAYINGMNVQIPYPKIFFVSFITFIIIYFLLAFALHMVNTNVFRGTSSFKKMVSLLGISLLPVAVLGLFAIVFVFLYPPLAVLALLIGFLLSNYYLYGGLKFATNQDENSHAYLLVISYAVVMIILWIVSKILG